MFSRNRQIKNKITLIDDNTFSFQKTMATTNTFLHRKFYEKKKIKNN